MQNEPARAAVGGGIRGGSAASVVVVVVVAVVVAVVVVLVTLEACCSLSVSAVRRRLGASISARGGASESLASSASSLPSSLVSPLESPHTDNTIGGRTSSRAVRERFLELRLVLVERVERELLALESESPPLAGES